MRIVFKPAGTLVLLVLLAVLCFLAFNNLEGIMGTKRADAEAPVGDSKAHATVNFHSLDLSRVGKVDWAYYGLTPKSGTDIKDKVVRKVHVDHRIGDLEFVGKAPNSYEDDPRGFKWNDGDGFSTMPDAHSGLTTNGISNGFRFEVTPDIGKRQILRVWVGGAKVRSKLMARMSDGSPLSQVDESTTNVGNGEFRSLYTIVYQAKKPGQKVLASYLVADGGRDGSVSLQAVAVE